MAAVAGQDAVLCVAGGVAAAVSLSRQRDAGLHQHAFVAELDVHGLHAEKPHGGRWPCRFDSVRRGGVVVVEAQGVAGSAPAPLVAGFVAGGGGALAARRRLCDSAAARVHRCPARGHLCAGGIGVGAAFLRASFFPFFLFAFMVPLGSLTEPATFPLRLLVSKGVALICQHLLAMDVVCNGTQLFNGMQTYQYDVAPACSGIRSLVAITAIAIIYAFTMFRTAWQRVLMMASAIPLAIIGNTFRMLVIVLAAEFGGQDAGNQAHESSFWSLLPYVPAILGLILLGRWLENIQERKAQADKPAGGGLPPA